MLKHTQTSRPSTNALATQPKVESGPASVPPSVRSSGRPQFELSGLARDSLIYGAGILLNKAVAFVMLPVFTRFLSPADYGVLQLVEMTIDVISILAGAQIAAGIFRFYHKAETLAERRVVLSTALLLLAASFTLAAFGGFQAAGTLSQWVFDTREHAGLIRIAAASLAFHALLVVPLAYLRARGRPVVFVVTNSIKLLLQLSLNILFLVHLGMAAQGVLLATLITNAVLGIGLGIFLIREVGLRLSAARVRDLLRFGIPLMVTQAATFFATFGDRYFLQQATDSTVVGLYTLAYQFGFLLIVVGYLPFSTAWDPARFAVAKRPQPERDAVYSSTFLRANVWVLTIAVGIALFVDDVLRIMAAPAFRPAADLVPVILCAYVLKSWTEFQNVGILVRERTEFVTLADWVAALAALGGYVWLIPRLHALGAALTTVVTFGVRQVLVYRISQRLWPVRYDWAPVRRLLWLAVATSLAGILAPVENIWISLGWHALLFVAYLLAVWHLGVLSPQDRAKIRAAARWLAGWLPFGFARSSP